MQKNGDDNKQDKLVTLAILTFTKAQILQTVLRDEGIEAVLLNVNQITPTINAAVKLMINEGDLNKALEITEKASWLNDDLINEKNEHAKKENIILLPVDFSEYSMKACEFGFNIAKSMNAKLVILHVYFTPIYAASLPNGDIFNYQKQGFDRETHIIHKQVKEKLEQLTNQIESKIATGEFPKIDYDKKLREGIPEEEIVRYARKHRVNLVIMGTRGSNQKKIDLIGSVTAEVIDRCRTTVFAIPENIPYHTFDKIKKIAFLTDFDNRDLIALDKLLQNDFPLNNPDISLVHISDGHNEWDQIELGGIKEYILNKYKDIKVDYQIIKEDEDFADAISGFITEHRVDVICLSSYRRNIFARLFNPSIARKMVFHSDTPLLIINV
ncbi:universal stress protein [Bacteroides propionicifaciens]|uniref:universal stress protein n=1 Tax=Bacteroides propionicifaciens TaxID=392838 RepID=UPI00036B25FF|nr:universal stress protein [Bacteroides propionicifaciens]